MVTPSEQNDQTKSAKPFVIDVSYEIFNLAVVIFSLVNIPVLWLLPLTEQQDVVRIIEIVISLYLFADAVYRLIRARSKKQFLWDIQGWLFFVGSVPIPLLRVARLVPVGLAMRRFKKTDYVAMGQVVFKEPAHSTLFAVILAAIVVLEAGAIWMLGVESSAANANIQNAGDALWWGIVTIGTVGYGDRYPVTTDGRIVGVIVIITGVALFTTLTSVLAQSFINRRKQATPAAAADREEWLNQLQVLRESMEKRQDEQTRLIRELQSQVEALRGVHSSDAN